MNATSRTFVGIALAVLIFIVGGLVGWYARGSSAAPSDVATVSFYDDWRLACPAASQKDRQCSLGQDLIDAKTHSQVAALSMTQLKSGAVLNVTVPFNVALEAGMALGFGKDKPKDYPFTTCNLAGCVAQIPVDAALRNSLRSQTQGHLLFEGLNKRVVQISFSLKGFQRADDVAAARNSGGGFMGMGS